MCEKQPLPADPVVRMTAPPAPPATSAPKGQLPAPRLLPGGFVPLPNNGELFRWPTAADS